MDTAIYDKCNDVNIIKISGKATMKNVTSIEKILNESIKTPILDFTETTYLDSTFLGLIAKYTMIFKNKNNEYLNLLKPNKEIVNILKQTGILKFLVILDEEILIEGKQIESLPANPKQILELHETLMNLNDENKKTFASVVEQMKKVVGNKDEK